MFKIEKCIKSALRESGKTAEGLAAESGMTKQTLYRLFNKDDAKLSQLFELAKALNVSIYDTFEAPGEQSPLGLGRNDNVESQISSNEKEELLVAQIAQLQDNNNVLKKYVASLERELARYQKGSGGSDTGSSQQTG
jgi:transcriptional regulator with XRE-family HTH domain